MTTRIDLPDEKDPSNVISIEVLREGFLLRQAQKTCAHTRIWVDPIEETVLCRDCKARLSAIEWLAQAAEHWARVRALCKTQREAAAKLEQRKRTRCQHCGRVTGITWEARAQIDAGPTDGETR